MGKIFASTAYDHIAREYEEHFRSPRFVNENSYIAEFIAMSLSPKCKVTRVLDLGCGSGLGYTLCNSVFKHEFSYTGVDTSIEMLKHAKSNLSFTGKENIELIHSDAIIYMENNIRYDLIVGLFGSPSYFDFDVTGILRRCRASLAHNGVSILMFYAPPSGKDSGVHDIHLNGLSVHIPSNCYSSKHLMKTAPTNCDISIYNHYSIARHSVSNHFGKHIYRYLEKVAGKFFPSRARYTTVVIRG